MPMSPYGMAGPQSSGQGIQEMLNQLIQQYMGGGQEQFIGEQQPGVNPIPGMDPSTMTQSAIPVTPGDVSGLATGMRGAAGLAGRIKAGLGFGRETLENAAPAAARNSQGLAGAMAGFGDEALGASPQMAPPSAPPPARMGNAPAPGNPYMPEGGLGGGPPLGGGPGPYGLEDLSAGVVSGRGGGGGVEQGIASSSPEIENVMGHIAAQQGPEALRMMKDLISQGLPISEVFKMFLSPGY